ncbi:MAG TPA: type II toxin-antitoxin system VapB family antitoxin [Acidobacteriaceae bacterium]|jgi:antitoxin VapB
MSLNIKNEHTHKLATELARLTGESITTAVTESVRERLDRVRARKGKGMARRLLAIADEYSANLPERYRSLDHADLLYDEKGLPK